MIIGTERDADYEVDKVHRWKKWKGRKIERWKWGKLESLRKWLGRSMAMNRTMETRTEGKKLIIRS